jgi:hypothetical protein
MLLHPRNYSNVGKTKRAAALEDKAKFWVFSHVMFWKLLRMAVPASRQNTK